MSGVLFLSPKAGKPPFSLPCRISSNVDLKKFEDRPDEPKVTPLRARKGVYRPDEPGYWNKSMVWGGLKDGPYQALQFAQEVAPHLAKVANLMIPLMPGRPLVSRNLKTSNTSSWPESLRKAVSAGWISLNSGGIINAIVIDCDHDDLDRLRDLVARGLPAPLYAVINPASGHYHAVWWLASPVLIGHGAKEGPQRLLRLARALLTTALDGDPDYNGQLTKNPFGCREEDAPRPAPKTVAEMLMADSDSPLMHHTIAFPSAAAIELKAIVAALKDEYRAPSRKVIDRIDQVVAEGRNCALFDKLRHWCYPRYETDAGEILAQAEALNGGFADPLGPKEVAGIARSVTKFMRDRYRPGSKQSYRGTMKLYQTDLPLERKQRLAALYAGRKQKDGNLSTIMHAAEQLGDNLTRGKLVAMLKGQISESTIKRRWPEVRAAVLGTPVEQAGRQAA